MKREIIFSVLFLTIIIAPPSGAELLDRGNGLIYDDILNVTWMQNANYSEGTLTWDDAMNWAGNMVFGGYNDWRLPETDTTCSGSGCKDSEMGHLYSYYDVTSDTPGIFSDVRPYMYWSGSDDSEDPAEAWRFHFKTGYQGTSAKKYKRYAWAVRDGDSSVPLVPEPLSSLLFIAGGIIMTLRRTIK